MHPMNLKTLGLTMCLATLTPAGGLPASVESLTLSGRIVDVVRGEVFPGRLEIAGGRIARVVRTEAGDDAGTRLLVPGLVDAHVHIESSMLSPAEFARMAVVHGTVGTVSDPHEIANVLGIPGVLAMIENGRTVPFHFHFGAPPCVPATGFEQAGAALDVTAVDALLRHPEIGYLSEMMNFPGVIAGAPDVLEKIRLARTRGKVVDGHAPGLRGQALRTYVSAGIQTDHECFTLEEAEEKIALGMKIIIRDGSAARNFAALHPLLARHAAMCLFGTDDCHPNDLERGHIDRFLQRAIALGHDPLTVLRCATLNPVRHYGLKCGLLQPGDSADVVVLDGWQGCRVLATYIGGRKVAEDGKSLLRGTPMPEMNQFRALPKSPSDFALQAGSGAARVIEVEDGQLVTRAGRAVPRIAGGLVLCDTETDVLKLAVVNRYADRSPAVALIRGFGLKRGALAASVAHDSHNIVAVGASDEDLALAVNAVIGRKGGLAVVADGSVEMLPLPIAGLMTNEDGYRVAARYSELDRRAKELGTGLRAPFMTLSFMALLVIPELKLSDRGLFDGKTFVPTTLFEGGDAK